MANYEESGNLRLSLDFLQRMRQRNEVMPSLDNEELTELDKILADGITYTPAEAVQLGRRAHAMLVRLKELDDTRAFLDFASYRKDDTERRELDNLINPPPANIAPIRPPAKRPSVRLTKRQKVVVVVVGLFVGAGVGIGIPVYTNLQNQTGPPAGVAQQNPPGNSVPISSTDLQNFKQDYGPFKQLTPSNERPQTGSPNLLLLETGGYFASERWTIEANSPSWSQDIGGNVNNVNVMGNYADITDADGNPYIVGINQPFVISTNPMTVLKIDPTGTVDSMTLAQATAIRQFVDS